MEFDYNNKIFSPLCEYLNIAKNLLGKDVRLAQCS